MSTSQTSAQSPAADAVPGPTAPLRHPSVGKYDILESKLVTRVMNRPASSGPSGSIPSLEAVVLMYLSGNFSSPPSLLEGGSSMANALRSIVELCGLAYIAQSTKASRKTDEDWFPRAWSKALLFGSSAIGGSVAFSDVDVLLLLGATVHPQYTPHSPTSFEAYNSWSTESYFNDFPALLERELNALSTNAVQAYVSYRMTSSFGSRVSSHELQQLCDFQHVHVTPITAARVPVLKFEFGGVHVDVVMAAYSPPLVWFDTDPEEDRTYPFPRDGQAVCPGPSEGDGALFSSHVQCQQPLFNTFPRQWQLAKVLEATDIQSVICSSTVTGHDHPETQLAKLLLLSSVEETLHRHGTGGAAQVQSNHLLLCSAAWLIFRRIPLMSMRGAINGVRTILLMQQLLPNSTQSEAYSTAPTSAAATPALASSHSQASPSVIATPNAAFPKSPSEKVPPLGVVSTVLLTSSSAILGAPPSPPPFSFYRDVFTIALKFIKVWAKRRAIYGNLYGYAPGVSWALLAVRGCQLTPSKYVSVVIRQFFKNITKLLTSLNSEGAALRVPPLSISKSLFIEDNAIAVPRLAGMMDPWRPALTQSNGAQTSNDVLPIISPAYPFSNSAHSASGSGRRVILEELKIAAAFLNSKPIREDPHHKFPVNSLVDLESVFPPYVFLPHPSYPITSSNMSSALTSPTSPVSLSFPAACPSRPRSPVPQSAASALPTTTTCDPLCAGGGFDAFLLVDTIVSHRHIRRTQQNPVAFYTKIFGIWAGFTESRIRFLVYSLESQGSVEIKDGSGAVLGIEMVRPFPDRVDRKVLIDGNEPPFANGPLLGVNNCGTMAIGLKFRIPNISPDATAAERCAALQRPEVSAAVSNLLQPAVNDFNFSLDSSMTEGKRYQQRKNAFVILEQDSRDNFIKDPIMAGPYCRLLLTSCEGGGTIPVVGRDSPLSPFTSQPNLQQTPMGSSFGEYGSSIYKRPREEIDGMDRKTSEAEEAANGSRVTGVYDAQDDTTERAAMQLLKERTSSSASPFRSKAIELPIRGIGEEKKKDDEGSDEEGKGAEGTAEGNDLPQGGGQGVLGDGKLRSVINVTSHLALMQKIGFGRRPTFGMVEGIHLPSAIAIDYFVYNTYIPQELCQPLA